MELQPLVLTFERSPEETRLLGVDEAIRELAGHGVDVKVLNPNVSPPEPPSESLLEKMLRFWFPYLSKAGVTGVTPAATPGPAAEGAEFIVTSAAASGPVLGTVLGAWLREQSGRKIRVKSSDFDLELRTPQQVEALLSQWFASQQDRRIAL